MTVLDAATRRAIAEVRELGRTRALLPSDPRERREIRVRAGVTAREFASALGVSRNVLLDWEAGRRSPSPGFRERYAEALHLLQEGARVEGIS